MILAAVERAGTVVVDDHRLSPRCRSARAVDGLALERTVASKPPSHASRRAREAQQAASA
jgi:hypothetical protein